MRRKHIMSMILFVVFLGAFFLYKDHQIGDCLRPPKNYHRIVVMSDPHYPSKWSSETNLDAWQQRVAAKINAVHDINSWKDVDLVAVLGDIVAEKGTVSDYEQAKEFIDRLTKPTAIIAGNHEFMYDDDKINGKLQRAAPKMRQEKLARFKATFQLSSLYYSKHIDHYLLIFLSPDVTDGRYLTEISPQQIDWLKETLGKNSTLPTLIFFHAPLIGTLEQYNREVNSPNFIAQPADPIRDILRQNPQVLLWVSGHTHTPATNPSFKSDVNLFANRILNVHNADMDRTTIWTNSIYLYPDKIVIRTFNHQTGEYMKELDRTIAVNMYGNQ